MIELQKFLSSGGTLEQLKEQYGIKSSRSKTYPNLVLLKYDQIDSPMGSPIVQEARGIILDENDNWRIVGRGFSKFFNQGEGHAAEIDWSTARVQEKCDGSLIMLYEYDGKWQVSTTGSPDASGDVFGFDFTFAELFQRTLVKVIVDNLGLDFSSHNDGNLPDSVRYPLEVYPELTEENKDTCYLFELMTPYNRVVVPHKEPKVVLLAARNRVTGDYVDAVIPGVPNVREFSLNSLEGVLASFESINGLDQEGYVVVDGAGNRVKVKHPQYVALHHLRDNMGPKWLAKVVVSGEVPELLTAFPEFEDDMNKVKEKYDLIVEEAQALYELHRGIESQKDFALAVKDSRYSGIMFALRSGKSDTVKHWLGDERHFTSALRLLGIKEDATDKPLAE